MDTMGLHAHRTEPKNQYFGQASQKTSKATVLYNLPRECTESNQRDYAAT